jgi:hypothetical protein
MSFNHLAWNKRFISQPGYNDAGREPYLISVLPANRIPNQPYWRCIGVHHLTGPENAGNHHVYLDVLDTKGTRINGARLMVVNNGKVPYQVVIDKPANEAGANVPMYWNDTLAIYLPGDLPTDKPTGFHIRLPDEEAGNTRGHHSFYAVWQLTTVDETPPIEPEPKPPAEDWRAELTPLERMIVNEPGAVATLIGKMRMRLDSGK